MSPQPQRRFNAGHTTLCSIYPLALLKQSRPYSKENREGGMTVFTIPAVPRGEFKTLKVYDSWQLSFNTLEPKNSDNYKVPILIFSDQIANDLINAWTGGLLTTSESGGHPGVAIIAGDQPTPDELQRMSETQTVFFQGLYYDGQRLAQAKDWRNITGLHRVAAEWLGKSKDSEAGWATKINPDDVEDCPACGSKIKSYVAICPVCRTQIRELSPELQRFNQMAAPVGGARPQQPHAETIPPAELSSMKRGGQPQPVQK